jgi:outer membrane immunogenic protein
MKSLLFGTAIAALIAAPALAADIAVKSAPAPAAAPAPSWAGFYVGLHAGVGWSNLEGSFNDPNGVLSAASVSGNQTNQTLGVLGGIQAGYNWQFAPAWVAGVEVDWSLSSVSASSTVTPLALNGAVVPNTEAQLGESANWLASARARLGFIGWYDTLFYVTGGAAWANIAYSGREENNPPTFVQVFVSQSDFDKTKTGWVVGAGLERQMAPHWLARIEYLYYNFGSNSSQANLTPNPGAFPIAFQYSWSNYNIQVVRVGLSYQFN